MNEKKDVLYDLFIKLNKTNSTRNGLNSKQFEDKKEEEIENEEQEEEETGEDPILLLDKNRGEFNFNIKQNQHKIGSKNKKRKKKIFFNIIFSSQRYRRNFKDKRN